MTGSGAAQPDTVTQWNLTMIAGLEAAAVPPPPRALAYTALVALIPAQKPLFDIQLAATLGQLSGDPAASVARGLAWGTAVAGDILAWRASDGFNAVLPPYVPGSAPGDWQPTPRCTARRCSACSRS